jgi:outer membrane protein assembly factor BamD
MNRRFVCLVLVTACVVMVPFRSPAPLVYRPGEGWTYEPVGSEGKWVRTRAKDQLEVAQAAFDKRDYALALKAARRVVSVWPLSDFSPQAQYLVGRCYEAKHNDERAFKEYQKIIEKYPKSENIGEVLKRQYEIAGRFLGGQWFKLWGYIPALPSMERTAALFDKIVKSGPYSDVAPHAQLRIGAARERQKNYPEAVKAYETAADRYDDRPQVAADALFRAGVSYQKQASTAEYDQSMAGKAIDTLTEFASRYPNDPRVPEAQKIMAALKTEQARGSYQIAKFYEDKKKLNGALVYYNQVTQLDPNSSYAGDALKRMDAIKKRLQPASR